MPKRKHIDLSKQKHESFLGLDLWNLILTYGRVSDQVQVAKLNKYYSLHFGGILHILKKAKNREHFWFEKAARYTASFDVLLPPFRWHQITGNQDSCRSFGEDSPTSLIFSEFCSTYPIIIKMLQTNIKSDDIVMGGDFPHRIIVKALRNYICPNIKDQEGVDDEEVDTEEEVKDDMFQLENYYDNPSIIQFFGNNDASLKQFCLDVFGLTLNFSHFNSYNYSGGISMVTEIAAPNQLDAEHSVEIMKAYWKRPGENPDPFVSFINRLDFTPAQLGFLFHNNQFEIFVTPGFLYSLFTGKMHFTYCGNIDWPFDNLDNVYDSNLYLSDPAGEHKLLLSGQHKCSFLRRYFKYKSLGYQDGWLNKEEEKMLDGFFNDVAYNEDDIFCESDENDESGYASNFFAGEYTWNLSLTLHIRSIFKDLVNFDKNH